MGYRNYIGIMDKKLHEEIKGMSCEELQNKFDNKYVSCYHISKEIFELGKYCNLSFLKDFERSLFDKKEVNEFLNDDGEFCEIGKEGLKAVIENMADEVIVYYKDLHADELGFIKNDLVEKVEIWKSRPYRFDSEEITTSWKKEYAIFELLRIYKSINWETQIVTLSGH